MGLTFDFKEVRNKLDELSKKATTTLADECLDAGKKPIIDTMKSEVPKATWELHDNLGELKKQGSGTGRKILIGINSEDREVIERGYYQEHGHSRMLGKKWMKRSFELAKTGANQEIIKVLREKLF